MIKFILKLIINLLLFSSYILSAQNNDEDSVYILEYNQELNEIKKDKKLYFFSEIHIDNLSFIFKESSLVDEKEKSASLYFSLYKYLYDSCGVRTFVFEAPISYEYFFSNFLYSGDTSWLKLINGYSTVKSQIYSLRELYLENKPLKIYCVDREYNHTILSLIDVMFYMVLYEPKKANPKLGISIDNDDNFNYFDSLLQDTRTFSPEFRKTAEFIANLKYLPKKKNSKLLYNEFSKIDTDTEVQHIYENLMKQNYDYFLRLKYSYQQFYKNKNKTMSDFVKREKFMLKNIEKAISKDTSNSLYCLFGYEHLLSVKPGYIPLYTYLTAGFATNNLITSGLIYYEQFKFMYPKEVYLFMDKLSINPQNVNIHMGSSNLPNYIILVR